MASITRDRIIKYLVQFVVEGQNEIRKATDSVQEFEDTVSDESGAGSSIFANAAVGAAGIAFAFKGAQWAADQFRDSIAKGLALQKLNSALDASAAKINLTAEQINSYLDPALKGVFTEAEAAQLALEAIEKGAISINDIRAYAVNAAEGMGYLADGARTAAGEINALGTEWEDFKASFGSGALSIIEPLAANANAAMDMDDALAAARAQLIGMGVDATTAGIHMTYLKNSGLSLAEVERRLNTLIADTRRQMFLTSPEAIRFANSLAIVGDAAQTAAEKMLTLRYQMGAGAFMRYYADTRREVEALSGAITEADAAAARSAFQRKQNQSDMSNFYKTATSDTLDATKATYGYAGSIRDADDAMRDLIASTGSMFDQARRMDEFNPAEYYYKQLLEAGASAAQLKEALVTTGLESEEDAQKIFERYVAMAASKEIANQAVAANAIGAGWQAAQASANDPTIAAQYGNTTINQGGKTIVMNVYGDVIDIEMIQSIVDEAIDNINVETGNLQG